MKVRPKADIQCLSGWVYLFNAQSIGSATIGAFRLRFSACYKNIGVFSDCADSGQTVLAVYSNSSTSDPANTATVSEGDSPDTNGPSARYSSTASIYSETFYELAALYLSEGDYIFRSVLVSTETGCQNDFAGQHLAHVYCI
ncbi:hypothetical protein AYI68_g4597 [Smittium mucronatum]|uniref:Uncharacterized protein n=1 Tax=Smittium mucronatum TaxID=133383 RepID=A0A1R0GWM5_9FUNG|nr:hypothetical protein AYI68_g4597 [Smittium mucronatum]